MNEQEIYIFLNDILEGSVAVRQHDRKYSNPQRHRAIMNLTKRFIQENRITYNNEQN